MPARLSDQPNGTLAKRESRCGPVGRPGQPEEIAGAVVFLASTRANFSTGQNLRVDGGHVPTVN